MTFECQSMMRACQEARIREEAAQAYALVDSSAFDERLATFPQSKSRGTA